MVGEQTLLKKVEEVEKQMNPAGSTKNLKGKITERSLMVGYHNGWTYMNENGINNIFSLGVANDGGVQVLKP